MAAPEWATVAGREVNADLIPELGASGAQGEATARPAQVSPAAGLCGAPKNDCADALWRPGPPESGYVTPTARRS